MKESIKKVIILVVGLLFMASCSQDRLEIEQLNVLGLEEYYATAGPDEAEALIVAIHNQYFAQLDGFIYKLFLNVLSDDHYGGGSSYSDNANFLNSAAMLDISPASQTSLNTVYVQSYKIIYWANLIIEKVPESTNEKVVRAKAEAKFFSALVMFNLMRWWGNPPLVDRVLGSDELDLPNGDHAEIIAWCLSRMQEAVDALPAISGKGQQKAFGARISKHAALAVKGKMALWYGTRYNNSEILAQSVEPLKAVIQSNLYGLIDDFSNLFRQQTDFCEEYIWEHNAAPSNGFPNNQGDNRHIWFTWRSEQISIPDQFYANGWGWQPPTGDFGDFLKAHEGGIEKPRFKGTILTYDQVLELDYENSVTAPGIFSPPISACDGYFHRKSLMHYEDVFWDVASVNRPCKANQYYIRYSEVLLMYAEAQFLVNNDADGSGLKALNEVRRRAEIPVLASMTYQDIKDERRAELWGEGERYFDLIRWGDAAEKLKDKGKTYVYFYGYKEGTTEWDIRVEPRPQGLGWQEKYQVLPYHQNQLNANSLLEQHPLWR
ncbi:RagB/SusD family nutrient uptake outer membrane protein [Parabacteroides sp. OttesenSCG-928-J18]|nr:RagB/SusD family nutrient uptake outer membrane protein [Parabacteroides sp. OttesenSCG-928-J18]